MVRQTLSTSIHSTPEFDYVTTAFKKVIPYACDYRCQVILPMNTVLIFSGCEYSLNNKGDQAMLEGLISWLKKVDSDSIITAYEMTPSALAPITGVRPFPSPEEFMLGIPGQHSDNSTTASVARIRTLIRGLGFIFRFVIYKFSGTRLLKESHITGFFHQILKADSLFFSGGGYLNGVWWADGLYSKVFPALVARMAGVPVVLVSQGLGPFHHPLDRFVAWILFSISSSIGVRDGEQSKGVVHAISKRSTSRVTYTGDDSLLVAPAPDHEVATTLRLEGVPEDTIELIAVNLRDSSAYKAGYAKPPFAMAAEALDELLEHPGRHVIFVPISYNRQDGDPDSARQIMSHMRHSERATVINGELHPSMIKGILAQAQIAIGTSYHFLLFALSQNIPVIALYQNPYYKQKLEGLCTMYGQEHHCLNMEGISAVSLIKASKEVLNQCDQISIALTQKNQALKKIFNTARSKIQSLSISSKSHV